MKVYEIISENSNILNEFGFGLAKSYLDDFARMIFKGGTAASAARKDLVEKLTDKYAAELVLARKEGRPDPDVYATLQKELQTAADKITSKHATELAAAKKAGKPEPTPLQQQLEAAGLVGKELKTTLDDVVKGAEKTWSKSSVAAADPKRVEAIKKAAAKNKEAAYAAQKLVAGLDQSTIFVLKALGITGLVINYYTEVKHCEAEYAKYPNSGIYRPNVSANGKSYNETQEAAYASFKQDTDKLLGTLELSVIAIIAPVKLAQLIKSSLSMFLGFAAFVGSLAGFGGAAVSAAGLGAGLVSLLTRASIALAKKAGMSVAQLEATGLVGLGAALTWIHTTDAGKEFVATGLLATITNALGSISQKYIEKFATLAKEYKGPGDEIINVAGNAVGSTVAGGGGPKAPPPSQATIDANAEITANEKLPRQLQITTRGKVKYLNNIKVTDNNGYLLTGLDSMIANAAAIAKEVGVPNPFDSIPKDPKVNYSINIAL
jgi:hypothetical protein